MWSKIKNAIDAVGRKLGMSYPPTPCVLVLFDGSYPKAKLDETLSKCPWKLNFVTTVPDAVQALLSEHFDVVVVHLSSSVFGLDAIRRLVAHPETQDLPVVALLDEFDMEVEQQMAAEGCVGTLHRPISPRAMTVALEEFGRTRPRGRM